MNIKVLDTLKTGDIFQSEQSSKKYVLLLKEIKIGQQLGVLAQPLTGGTCEFFSHTDPLIKLQPNKTQRRGLFSLIKKFNHESQIVVEHLKAKCEHDILNESDRAICLICAKDFGWWCDKSQDNNCHYYSDNGFVSLINRKTAPVPKDHDEDYENRDSCIFCGQPDNRK